MTYWLSYGGGVNSTALAILLCEGKLPQHNPWRCMWSDTHDEEDHTYDYVENVFVPYLGRYGKELERVRPKEGVIERWERLKVTGSRIVRSCTDEAKVKPLGLHLKAHAGPEDVQLIGIDADQPHRARPAQANDRVKLYPLVTLDIDRVGCEEIIRQAGLPVPKKSGCWHCPFKRVGEVLAMARDRPERLRRIIALERVATETHGLNPKTGGPRTQWNDTTAADYGRRACAEQTSGPLFQEVEPDPPCDCYDG